VRAHGRRDPSAEDPDLLLEPAGGEQGFERGAEGHGVAARLGQYGDGVGADVDRHDAWEASDLQLESPVAHP
jgi:hypothetical protein